MECKLHSVTRASRYCVTGDFVRNTLRSANTKNHYIFPSLQWYKTKEGLPLMNSCVFWSGVIGLVDSLAPFCDLWAPRCLLEEGLQPENSSNHSFFFRPEVNFHHRHNLVNVSSPSILRMLLDMNISSLHVPKHLLSANARDGLSGPRDNTLDTGLGSEVKFLALGQGWVSQLHWMCSSFSWENSHYLGIMIYTGNIVTTTGNVFLSLLLLLLILLPPPPPLHCL